MPMCGSLLLPMKIGIVILEWCLTRGSTRWRKTSWGQSTMSPNRRGLLLGRLTILSYSLPFWATRKAMFNKKCFFLWKLTIFYSDHSAFRAEERARLRALEENGNEEVPVEIPVPEMPLRRPIPSNEQRPSTGARNSLRRLLDTNFETSRRVLSETPYDSLLRERLANERQWIANSSKKFAQIHVTIRIFLRKNYRLC